MTNEIERTQKKGVVALIEVLSPYLTGVTKENLENFLRIVASGPRF
jgi:hypothetical protein